MAVCEFCKNDNSTKGSCAYCGDFICNGGGSFVFGSKGEKVNARICISSKYIIVDNISSAGTVGLTALGAGFGIAGVLLSSALESAIKKTYAYYDIQEIEKAIYPYQNVKYKKDLAVKFINKDGTDFILVFDLNGVSNSKSAKIMIDGIAKAGIYIENGLDKNYGTEYCNHPFVNKDTFCTRICTSASTFVKMTKKNFVAESINNCGSHSFQQSINNVVTDNNSVYTANSDDQFIVCPTCGETTEYESKFCPKCGTSLSSNPKI